MQPKRRIGAGPRAFRQGQSSGEYTGPTRFSRSRSIATWTVVSGGFPVSWASRSKWSAQPRPLRGADPDQVPPPFRGITLAERHPDDPPIAYTEEERRILCPLCQVPEIHRGAHHRGSLHRTKVEATRAVRSSEGDIAAAIALLESRRPELLRRPEHMDEELLEL